MYKMWISRIHQNIPMKVVFDFINQRRQKYWYSLFWSIYFCVFKVWIFYKGLKVESLRKKKQIRIKSSLMSRNHLFTVHGKVTNDTINIHQFKVLVALFIVLTSERNLRLVIDYAPEKYFVFHTMSHLDKLTSHMFGRNGYCNAWRGFLFCYLLFSHVFVFVIIQMT